AGGIARCPGTKLVGTPMSCGVTVLGCAGAVGGGNGEPGAGAGAGRIGGLSVCRVPIGVDAGAVSVGISSLDVEDSVVGGGGCGGLGVISTSTLIMASPVGPVRATLPCRVPAVEVSTDTSR